MYYLKKKNIKYRIFFKNSEMQIKLKNFIYKNLLSYFYKKKNIIQLKICFKILQKKRKRIITKITNRCILTNRPKSIRKLKISRIKMRDLISYGILPGFKKAIW